ncbi:MAG: hypothetical protein OXF62_16180 [Caldilineaceae bacterium]|nr:hypothetical protein [Caldilineaceae bacterium]MCY4117055.1 hypothetical protein [Caldilineaceae bacterium]
MSLSSDYLETLDRIQDRVLWLSMRIVHEANSVRRSRDGVKVGGHQASSASMVTLMTALYFHLLKHGDRVSVKPHASPVFHAIQYLLGQLPREYLTTLRAYGGLQAYPSRTKDPDPVDFSTGSVGLGAVAPAFAALTDYYARRHFGDVASNRFIAIIGDAELDEGNIWEAIFNDWMAELGNTIWIVDLNRQSLDRVVPGIRAGTLKSMFDQWGWKVLEAKYGRKLQNLFAQKNGEQVRKRIDDMSNEEYQLLVRLPGDELRRRFVTVNGHKDARLEELLAPISDAELPSIIGNLGGHDLAEMIGVLEEADATRDRPAVIFAYTIKGWRLPIAGDPHNHSKLLNDEEMSALAEELAVPGDDHWASFAPDTDAGALCRKIGDQLYSPSDNGSAAPIAPAWPVGLSADDVPQSVPSRTHGTLSTQQSFGQILVSMSRDPKLAPRIVTTSPDVSTSTNLSGWIAKQGVFSFTEGEIYELEENRGLSWRYGPEGQHIELGISEMNLFMMLAMLGLSAELTGQQLIPIGTVYDPFVLRGLDSFIYGLYANARFIVVGTPSGVSLAPEGGAHQSTVTPSLCAELPNLNSYEPCFAQELVWIMLEAVRQCCRDIDGRATYLRLSTKPVDQSLLEPALARLGETELRRQVLEGGYRLLDWQTATPAADPGSLVHIATTGIMLPEAMEAAALLQAEGIAVNVLNLTSPRRLYENWRAAQWGRRPERTPSRLLSWLIPPDQRQAPIVTVQDGASHNLAWLGSLFGSYLIPLGVDDFGQSGTPADLYRHFEIDSQAIFESALVALNRTELG